MTDVWRCNTLRWIPVVMRFRLSPSGPINSKVKWTNNEFGTAKNSQSMKMSYKHVFMNHHVHHKTIYCRAMAWTVVSIIAPATINASPFTATIIAYPYGVCNTAHLGGEPGNKGDKTHDVVYKNCVHLYVRRNRTRLLMRLIWKIPTRLKSSKQIIFLSW